MFESKPSISIVIPTLNEAANVYELIKRLHATLTDAGVQYELIFIDDHSTDSTVECIHLLSCYYPMRVDLKQGKAGKAYSLLEGFRKARYENIAMIDADLQYPPEAIPNMLKQLEENRSDIVVANRETSNTNWVRQIASNVNRTIFGKYLWGMQADVQSGLKVFRKDVIRRVNVNPRPWTFDLEFLIQARNGGYRISSYDIEFSARTKGETKISLLSSTPQIIRSAVKLKFSNHGYISFNEQQITEKGNGFHYKGEEYVPHNTLEQQSIALQQTNAKQKVILFTVFTAIALGFFFDWRRTLAFTIATLTTLYFIDLIFNLNLIYRSLSKDPEIKILSKQIAELREDEWPTYTILCPLYKESAVLPQFVKAMSALDYDQTKLQILLLLEENDEDTILSARRMELPNNFEIVIVPHSMPKTKPKACNYGLLRAKGEYAVIYDAEDVPDPLQLKQAYLAFRQSANDVVCIQCKLNFYNPTQNLLTRAFTAEYSLWFDLILTGMQQINAPIPLGGTSNHFKTSALLELGGWDAFNVTEDADLGIRLVKHGYKTRILDSTTLEEANSNPRNWFWQRSRWIKGYIQTYLVHTRDLKAFRNGKKRDLNAIMFQLIIGGKVLSMLVNPVMWLLTITYFVLRAEVGPTIQSLFPMPVLYVGVVSLIFGNFLFVYYYMVGCARRQYYGLIKYAIFIPFYWLAMSAAAYYALIEFIYKPHHWRKTKHGLHLQLVQTLTELSD